MLFRLTSENDVDYHSFRKWEQNQITSGIWNFKTCNLKVWAIELQTAKGWNDMDFPQRKEAKEILETTKI